MSTNPTIPNINDPLVSPNRIITRAWYQFLQGVGQEAFVSTGTITGWAGTAANVPKGYLFTNGATVPRLTYPDLNALAAANGYAAPFGPGDGVQTFVIPTVANSMIKA